MLKQIAVCEPLRCLQAQEDERRAKQMQAAQYRQAERTALANRTAAKQDALQKQKQGHGATLAIQVDTNWLCSNSIDHQQA